jgi:hypothetical protein
MALSGLAFFLSAGCLAAAVERVNPEQIVNLSDGSVFQPGTEYAGEVEIGGEILDLAKFDDEANPFGWSNWMSYDSVQVENGSLAGRIGESATRPARLITDRYAYFIDPDRYRFLELTFTREKDLGDLVVYFRVDGNSVATAGQALEVRFDMPEDVAADRTSVIVDMSLAEAWGRGVVTGLGLDLQSSVAGSKDGTLHGLHSVRIGSALGPASP